MPQRIEAHYFNTKDDYPDGGQTFGAGLSISWQRGALAGDVGADECIFEHDDEGKPDEGLHIGPCRRSPNGAFVETVIAAAADRLGYYQTTPFACASNDEAIRHLVAALDALGRRTETRQVEQVEGTHEASSEEQAWRDDIGQRRIRLIDSLGWAAGSDVWITQSSGGVVGPTNIESAVDILLDDPMAQVHVVDPNG